MTARDQLPRIVAPPPGPASTRLVETLARTESPAFTARRARRAEASGAPHDPIVWAEARGANVVDADGNVYVDLTSGFGAASIGHAHPRVVGAVQRQSARLLQALGDVHPSDVKIALLERLASMAPWPDARVVLGVSGSDAVECALETCVLATGRAGVLAFEGGYHGLAYGPLAACGYKEAFRAPFAAQLNPHVVFAPFPAREADVASAVDAVAAAWDRSGTPIGAVLVEPVQGRGGARVPPPGFVAALGALSRARGALLVADEIFVGLGRCGARWRSVDDGASPDLVCAGKGLGGGLPISACIGRAGVMAAWGAPEGESLHTGTFFGHPVSSAAALATLDVIEGEGLVARAARVGAALLDTLRERLARHAGVVRDVRGAGLMLGVEIDDGRRALAIVRRLLERGWLVLPAGAGAEVVQIVPPLSIDEALLDAFVEAIDDVIAVST